LYPARIVDTRELTTGSDATTPKSLLKLMARKSQSLRIVGVISAGALLVLCTVQGSRSDPEIEKLLRSPGIVETFREDGGSNTNDHPGQGSPLITQAQAFALYLDPSRAREGVAAPIPAVRPISPSPKFTLHATCYYPSRPEESLALVCEPGGEQGTFRWVKQGTEMGHFVIETIKRGAIIYRDGERACEMLVERGSPPESIVRSRRTEVEPSRFDGLTLGTAEADVNTMGNVTPPLRPVIVHRER